MSVSAIRDKLNSAQPTIGTWMQIPNADLAEILGKSGGYDWVALDLEHGAFSRRDLVHMFRALELSGTVPMARISQCGPTEIKQALDTGAMGLIFPMIEQAKQLVSGISWANYPPQGTRGVGYCRANQFGNEFTPYMTKIGNSQPLIIAQIEHVNAISDLDAILNVKGLDAIMVGPYDLSGSMGLTAQFKHPSFVEAMAIIEKKAQTHRIPMGLHIVQPDKDLLMEKIKNGYQFIAYGTDAVFFSHACHNPLDI